MNILDALMLEYPNANPMMDFQVAQDKDGNLYISIWNLPDPEPDAAQLQSLLIKHDLLYRQNSVRAQRKLAYPSLGDQLDMQYHDAINGTTVWIDTIEAIKQQYPIPQE